MVLFAIKIFQNRGLFIQSQFQQEELTTGAIAHEIKHAKKQRARIVYLKALNEMSKDDLKKALKSEVLRSPIRIIYLDWKGTIKQISRKVIREMSW